jgi:hypothetical protein
LKEVTDDERSIVKAGAEAALRPISNLIEKLFGGTVEERYVARLLAR